MYVRADFIAREMHDFWSFVSSASSVTFWTLVLAIIATRAWSLYLHREMKSVRALSEEFGRRTQALTARLDATEREGIAPTVSELERDVDEWAARLKAARNRGLTEQEREAFDREAESLEGRSRAADQRIQGEKVEATQLETELARITSRLDRLDRLVNVLRFLGNARSERSSDGPTA